MSFFTLLLILFLAIIIFIGLAAYSFYRQLRNAAKRFRPHEENYQTKVNGNVIIDRRSETEKQKKIIPDDEGEYVSYEES